uniref:Uncharacterized protein n=1 Tax=Pristionchus pacificus TaxID=54126 RepID=A0A2A6C432_PRIPA|eukprot:PDM72876.1 hypothetical protein PRIPAC_39310 [Pristionchus pacificus]
MIKREKNKDVRWRISIDCLLRQKKNKSHRVNDSKVDHTKSVKDVEKEWNEEEREEQREVVIVRRRKDDEYDEEIDERVRSQEELE